MRLREKLEKLAEEASRDPRFRREFRYVDATIEVRTLEGETIYLQVRGGEVNVLNHAPGDPDLTLTASHKVFQDLLESRISGEWAVLTGRLKIAGDLGLGERLYRKILKLAKR